MSAKKPVQVGGVIDLTKTDYFAIVPCTNTRQIDSSIDFAKMHDLPLHHTVIDENYRVVSTKKIN